MSELFEIKPSSLKEVVQQLVWVYAMVEIYDSMVRNNVWEVVPRLIDKSVVGSRWIYKVNHATDESIEKQKAMFLVKGFSQVEGIDYEENFVLVERYSFIRLILALLV